jgi:NADP-dependent 3-hydroxy acid dehydrogenase YdfG
MEGFQNLSIEKLALDVTSDEDVERVIKTILDAEGKIDIVVNNAGVMGLSTFALEHQSWTYQRATRRRPSGRFVSRTS